MSAELKRRIGTTLKLAYTSFTNTTDGAKAYNLQRIYKALIPDGHLSIGSFVNTLLNRSVFLQEAQVRILQQQYGF